MCQAIESVRYPSAHNPYNDEMLQAGTRIVSEQFFMRLLVGFGPANAQEYFYV